MYNILICDDEKDIVNALEIYLGTGDYKIFKAYNGKEALDILETQEIHLVLMDIMMPQMDGIEALEKIRQQYNMPVIMLSAKSEDVDKINGLNLGADDYITKPFNILEVKARIKAIFRRMDPKKGTAENTVILESGDLKLDREGRRAYIQGREIGLTAKEFEVLELLMLNPDKVYSRENLLKLVWGTDYPGDVRTVDVHIRRLREKIELSPSEPRYVHTKWGVGYYFNDKLSHGQNA